MIWRSALILLALVSVSAVSPSVANRPPGQNACQGCRSLLSYATTFNSTSHRQEYRDLFKNFCELHYPVSTDFQQGPCPMFVEGLFYVLDHTDPVHHCDQIGACGQALPSDDIYDYLAASRDANQPHKGDEVLCTYCKNLIDQVKASLTNPDTVEQLRRRSDEFCEYLKVIEEDEKCRSIIEQYLDGAVLFISLLDSKTYCASIDMCPSRFVRATPVQPARAPAAALVQPQAQLPTMADFSNFGIETSVSIGTKSIDMAAVSHLRGPQCNLCKTIVKEMFHFIRENKTEANIIQGLERVCRVIYPSGPRLEQCQSMVKAYTKEIVQLLIDETDPEVVCMLLEQCAYDQVAAKQSVVAPMTSPRPDSNSGLAHLISALDTSIGLKSLKACVECKMFIRYLRDELQDQSSQEQLKQWLMDNLCAELPDKELVKSCGAMVETYAETFFKAVVRSLNPQSACVELGVCNARSIVQVFQLGSGPETPLGLVRPTAEQSERAKRISKCAEVVSRIDDHLSRNALPEDGAAMSRICNNFENPLVRSNCNTIIRQYGTEIAQKIVTMDSPRQLCQEIVLHNN